MYKFKKLVKSIPLLGPLVVLAFRKYFKPLPDFSSSGKYWEDRYKLGLNSGDGSYNKLAKFKAEILNDFVKKHDVFDVVEWGCGDGNQLSLMQYKKYHGFDVSFKAISICNNLFSSDETRSFSHISSYNGDVYDLAISLDVIYHLVEDNIYEEYMHRLFTSSKKYVVIYSSDISDDSGKFKHVKHRHFTDWVSRNYGGSWYLVGVIKNKYPFNGNPKESSFADFFIYHKVN